MDFDGEDAAFSSLPGTYCPPSSSSNPMEAPLDNSLLRNKPFHTYSRNNVSSYGSPSGKAHPRAASISSGFPSSSNSEPSSSSSLAPPQSPTNSVLACSLATPRPSTPLNSYPSTSVLCATNGTTSDPAAISSSLLPPSPYPSAAPSSSSVPPSCSVSSSSLLLPPPPVTSYSQPSSSSLPPPTRLSSSLGPAPFPLPPGASSVRAHEHVAQLACQSLQQQQASRRLLESVSQSLDGLAQSVQLLVESQQEFVQESLMLQKETVDILKDFSVTALAMLREKPNHGHDTAPRQPEPPQL